MSDQVIERRSAMEHSSVYDTYSYSPCCMSLDLRVVFMRYTLAVTQCSVPFSMNIIARWTYNISVPCEYLILLNLIFIVILISLYLDPGFVENKESV
jgi:hypothetical protein